MASEILRSITISGQTYSFDKYPNYCLSIHQDFIDIVAYFDSQRLNKNKVAFNSILLNDKPIPNSIKTQQDFFRYLGNKFINCCSNIRSWYNLKRHLISLNSYHGIHLNDCFTNILDSFALDDTSISCFIFGAEPAQIALSQILKVSLKPFNNHVMHTSEREIFDICQFGVIKMSGQFINFELQFVPFIKDKDILCGNKSCWYDKKYNYTIQADKAMLAKLRFTGVIK